MPQTRSKPKPKRAAPSSPQTPPKKYWEMTADELREATKEFDAPSPPGTWKPASATGKLLWDRARRKPDPFFDLSDEEREKEVARFDREMDEGEFSPLNRKQRRLMEMAGVPITKEKVTIEIAAVLRDRAEAFAKSRGLTFDELVEASLEGHFAFTEATE